MAVAQRVAPSVAYRRILVPVSTSDDSEEAVEIACRLAADHGATVHALAVIEVPLQLPLSAHMPREELAARRAVATAAAIGDLYGVDVSQEVGRARFAGEAIVEEARLRQADVVVLHASRRKRRRHFLGPTADVVLKHAPCRVIVGATPGRD
jgi:nucleotide-binding universal stress UspA family protein